jgi:hypothetical protein
VKLFFITTKERSAALRQAHHYMDLPNGKVLLVARDEGTLEHWAKHEDVTVLPHPIFESAVPLADEHIEHVKHLKIKKGHTVLDLIKEAAKHHPAMRLHVL